MLSKLANLEKEKHSHELFIVRFGYSCNLRIQIGNEHPYMWRKNKKGRDWTPIPINCICTVHHQCFIKFKKCIYHILPKYMLNYLYQRPYHNTQTNYVHQCDVDGDKWFKKRGMTFPKGITSVITPTAL